MDTHIVAIMTWADRISLFSTLDYVALAALIWLWTGWRIERPAPQKPSVSILMDELRHDWMRQMVRA